MIRSSLTSGHHQPEEEAPSSLTDRRRRKQVDERSPVFTLRPTKAQAIPSTVSSPTRNCTCRRTGHLAQPSRARRAASDPEGNSPRRTHWMFLAKAKSRSPRPCWPVSASNPYLTMISVSIDLSKLDESHFYAGKATTFLNVLLTSQTNRFGNFEVIQGISKEQYAAGVRGEVCGTWRDLGGKSGNGAPSKQAFDLSKYKKASQEPAQAPPAKEQPRVDDEDFRGLRFDMHFSPPSRVREFRHCFSGTRRIVATVRVDLSRVRFEPRSMSCIRCEWEGSRVKQPSSELFEEYRAWMHHVLSIVVSQTGTPLLYVFEAPAPVKEIELWLL